MINNISRNIVFCTVFGTGYVIASFYARTYEKRRKLKVLLDEIKNDTQKYESKNNAKIIPIIDKNDNIKSIHNNFTFLEKIFMMDLCKRREKLIDTFISMSSDNDLKCFEYMLKEKNYNTNNIILC